MWGAHNATNSKALVLRLRMLKQVVTFMSHCGRVRDIILVFILVSITKMQRTFWFSFLVLLGGLLKWLDSQFALDAMDLLRATSIDKQISLLHCS